MHFGWRSRHAGKSLREEIRRFCQHEHVPFSIALLSAFQTLLLRYTSQEDLVLGCTLSDFGTGDSVSTAFLLRADLSGDPSFRDLVSRTYAAALEGTAQGGPCLSELMEELTSQLGVQAPTFQVSFSYGNRNSRAGHEAAAHQSATLDVPVDLHLDIEDEAEELPLRLLYNQDLFDAGSIDRTLLNLETLLWSAVQTPDQQLSNLPILTKEEEHQILVEWNGNVQEYERDKCLHQLVAAQAERAPDGGVVSGQQPTVVRRVQ